MIEILRNIIPFEHITQSPVTVHLHTSLWVGVTTDPELLQCSFQTCSPIASECKANFSLRSEMCICVSVTSHAFRGSPNVVGASLALGEYSTVCFEICDHWTVSSHRHADPIINSLRLITFGDRTLAPFCYWMRWPYCTFVSRAVLQNDLLQYVFYSMH